MHAKQLLSSIYVPSLVSKAQAIFLLERRQTGRLMLYPCRQRG